MSYAAAIGLAGTVVAGSMSGGSSGGAAPMPTSATGGNASTGEFNPQIGTPKTNWTLVIIAALAVLGLVAWLATKKK